MLITTSIALVLKLHGTVTPHAGRALSDWPFYYLNLSVGVVALGFALPAIYWLPAYYIQTKEMLRQPGHWMLSAQLLVSIWYIGFYVAYLSQTKFDSSIRSFFSSAFFFGVGFHVAAVAVLFIAAIKLNEVRWKIALVLLAVFLFNQGLENTCIACMTADISDAFDRFDTFYDLLMAVKFSRYIVVSATLISIAIAILVDWRRKASRDWLHWMGVISTVAVLTSIPLINYLSGQYLQF